MQVNHQSAIVMTMSSSLQVGLPKCYAGQNLVTVKRGL